MNILQKIGAIVLFWIGLFILLITFMYAFEIYPQNCSVLIYPLNEKCIEAGKIGIYEEVPMNVYNVDFIVNVPDYTPKEDVIYLETEIGNYRMENIGKNLWSYKLKGIGSVKYRYNRNNLKYLSAEEFSNDTNTYRETIFEKKAKKQEDVVDKWRYMSGRSLENIGSEANSFDIKNKIEQKGFAMLEYWENGFINLTKNTAERIKLDNGNWIMLGYISPYSEIDPLPAIASANENSLLIRQISDFRQSGLNVMLKTKLCCNNPPNKKYSDEWWNSWFDNVEKNLIEVARFSRENNIDAVLIDYSYGSSIPNELYAPKNAYERWGQILKNIRTIYSGKIGFGGFVNGDYKEISIIWPNGMRRFSTDVDFYGIEVWVGVADNPDVKQEILDKNAEKIVDNIAMNTRGFNKPIIITGLAYPSVHKSELGEVGVSSATPGLLAFEQRNNELFFDGREQAMIYEAFMKAIATSTIAGVYTYGFSYVELPDARDYSIRGKEAEKVVKGWFAKY